MITFYYDESKDIPMYEQLYQYLKTAIEKKEIKANEKLPSKRKLASHLHISETTIETAYLQLLAEGYIQSKPRVGYFVLDHLVFPKRRRDKVIIDYQSKVQYLYDFKTNKVDQLSFPYLKFAKINRDIILDRLSENLNETDHFGLYSFREKIADILFAYRGIEAKPEQIVIGSGSEHMISLLVLLLGRDKHMITEEPSYLKNAVLYKEYGAKVSVVALDELGIKIDDIKALKGDVVHVTPSHQFPTGIITPMTRRIELLKWANQGNGRYIVEDDYDSEFRFNGNPIPALKVLDNDDKVIYMNSFSKSISPGIRVSFMVLPMALLRRYHHSFSYFSCSVPLTTQLTLESFIDSGQFEKHLNRMKIIYKNKRDLLITELTKAFSDRIHIKGDDAGLHFLVEIETSLSEKQLIDKAKDVDIRVYGLSEYYQLDQLDYGQATLVFGYAHLSEDELKSAVSLIEKAWNDL